MYAATTEEVVQDAAAITCTLITLYFSTSLMFDFGSTYTFISKTFVDRIGVSIEDLGNDFLVSNLARAVLTTGVRMRDVNVFVQQHILLADLRCCR